MTSAGVGIPAPGHNVLFDVDPNVPLIEKENYMHQFKQLIEGDFQTKDLK